MTRGDHLVDREDGVGAGAARWCDALHCGGGAEDREEGHLARSRRGASRRRRPGRRRCCRGRRPGRSRSGRAGVARGRPAVTVSCTGRQWRPPGPGTTETRFRAAVEDLVDHVRWSSRRAPPGSRASTSCRASWSCGTARRRGDASVLGVVELARTSRLDGVERQLREEQSASGRTPASGAGCHVDRGLARRSVVIVSLAARRAGRRGRAGALDAVLDHEHLEVPGRSVDGDDVVSAERGSYRLTAALGAVPSRRPRRGRPPARAPQLRCRRCPGTV